MLDSWTIQFSVLSNCHLFSSSSFLWESGFCVAAVFPGIRSLWVILVSTLCVVSLATLDLKNVGLGAWDFAKPQSDSVCSQKYYPMIKCFICCISFSWHSKNMMSVIDEYTTKVFNKMLKHLFLTILMKKLTIPALLQVRDMSTKLLTLAWVVFITLAVSINVIGSN